MGGEWPNAPQKLLASVSENLQRFTKQLQPHSLDIRSLQGTKTSHPKASQAQSLQERGCRSHQINVEDEGVLTPLQVRNHIHRSAMMLCTAFLGKLGRVGTRLKDHHTRMKDEGDARKAARRARKENEAADPLRLALPWQRKRRRGPHNEGAIFRMGGPKATAQALIQRGKEHEREMDVRAAVRCYEDANKLVPDVPDTLCLAAKAWSDVCYLDEVQGASRERLTEADKQAVNRIAMGYAQRAMRLSPDKALPHIACCISMGRLAVFSGNRTMVKLAKDARELAVVALQKEPTNDLAHHLMGRWHSEMAKLNSVVRALVKLMYGAELPPGTHAQALVHYRRASELAPGRLVHRVELGRSLAREGDRERALAELEHAITLDVEDINAHLQKVDAEILVMNLRRSIRRRLPAAHHAQVLEATQPEPTAAGGVQAPRGWPLGWLPGATGPEQAGSSDFGAQNAAGEPAKKPWWSLDSQPAAAAQHPKQRPEQAAGGLHHAAPGWGPFWPPRQQAPEAATGSAQSRTATAAACDMADSLPKQAPGWRLPHLKNPFEGIGKRIAPDSP